MKKYIALFVMILSFCCSGVRAADFGNLLERLDSRDFSAEKDVALRNSGPYTGETLNPHSETVMFKAREELMDKILAAKDSKEKRAEINAFMSEAVTKKIQNETKVWLLLKFELTGTAKEVPVLVAFLKDKEHTLVDAAAAALAKIPGPEAQAALEKNADIPAVKSALVSRKTIVPALRPNEKKMPLGLSNISAEEFKKWMDSYDKYDETLKVQTLAALTAREDRQYRDKVLAAISSDSPRLQKAGFLALEKLATKDDVELFIKKLNEDRSLTIRLCSFIVADGFDDAFLAELRKTTDTKRFLDLATILMSRSVDIRKDIFVRTMAKECPDRLALLQQASKLITKDDIPELVASTVLIPRGKDHDTAENIIAICCNKDATPLINLIGKYPQAIIYPIMCRTGGDAAKKELTHGLESNDPQVQAAALRALSQWSDAFFADTMLKLINTGKLAEGMNQSLLRAYIRVMSLPDDKIGIKVTKDQKLDNLKKAFAIAKRADEKKLILSRLAANRTDKSLAFAVECAAQPELAEAAYSAIADHAHDTALRKQFADQIMKAINLVIENSKDKKLVERVKVYKGRM